MNAMIWQVDHWRDELLASAETTAMVLQTAC